MDDASTNFVGAQLVERAGNGFDRALHVALDHQREFLHADSLELGHHLFERAPLTGLTGSRLVARQTLAVFGNLTGAAFAFDDCELVACRRCARQTENLDRRCRCRFLHMLALVVDQRTNAAPLIAGNDDLARTQCTLLHEDGGDGAAAAVELGFDDGTFRRAVRIGLEI
jgi:hypothetical protein